MSLLLTRKVTLTLRYEQVMFGTVMWFYVSAFSPVFCKLNSWLRPVPYSGAVQDAKPQKNRKIFEIWQRRARLEEPSKWVKNFINRTLGRLLVIICLCTACGEEPPEGQLAEKNYQPQLSVAARKSLSAEAAVKAKQQLDTEYPNYGAVTGTELRVYADPSPEAVVVGWLRIGAQVRLSPKKRRVKGCPGGFYPIHPTGFVCASDGLDVQTKPFKIEHPSDYGWKNNQVEKAHDRGVLVLPPAAKDAPLPYDYYFVKAPAIPSFHRLPSRNEQRAALAKAAHFLELLEKNEKLAKHYLTGESNRGPHGTQVTARYLERGFFVASNGSEVRAFRRFVRTNKGRYIKKVHLEERYGDEFKGVELNDTRKLPIAWTVRTTRPLTVERSKDGTTIFRSDEAAETIERQTLLVGWKGLRRFQDKIMHEIETNTGIHYLRSWFAAVAYPIKRPREVKATDPWVHVDTRQQTAVLYQGDKPVYATLVSTGIDGYDTPPGVYEIRRKRVTDTMANLGPEAGDDSYRIEDIPWTQYFERSFALHAAFWHTRFGTKRSHGCVNLSPTDAYHFFQETLPAVPDGWHGISTEGTHFRGSYVVVTDNDLSVVMKADDNDSEEANESQTYGIRVAANWIEPWRKRLPKQVTYTIKLGGTARFVANLFGLFHHEMATLNPKIDLDAVLEPGTELVVYRYNKAQPSHSLGYPDKGSLQGAAPLPNGEGRILKSTPRKMWATRRTVAILETVFRAWPRIEPYANPILVGNLSMRKGGKLKPHRTHQSGRDVDIGYPQIQPPVDPYNWRNMNKHNLDIRRTWRLLHLFETTGELEQVFIDRSLQKLLFEYALNKSLLSAEELSYWLEYPRTSGKGSPLVRHAADHIDHIHVRIKCGREAECKTRERNLNLE